MNKDHTGADCAGQVRGVTSARQLRQAALSLDAVIQVALVGTVLLAGAMAAYWHQLGLGALGIVVASTAVQTVGLEHFPS